MNILYLLKHFPCLSQTFVLNEVVALTRLGCRVHIVSAIDLDEPVALPPEIAARVAYLQHGYFYSYGTRDRSGDSARATAAALALAGSDRAVPAAERQRLWDIIASCEQDDELRPAAFLDSLAVTRLVREQGIEHLHADFAEDNVRLAYIVSQATDVPFTFKLRAYDIFAEPPTDVPLWARAASRVMTISRYNVEYVARRWGIDQDSISLIYDGVNLAEVAPVTRYAHRPFRIVSASRLVDKKGFPILVDACAALRRRGLEVQCDVYGDGPARAGLQARISALALDGIVRLHGAVPHASLLEVLADASVFALASVEAANGDRDATPNVLLEAMGRALPVVSTSLSGIPEIVTDGVDGLLVAPGDPDALADAMARIAADRDFADRLRRAARRTVAERFDIERTAGEFLRVLAPAHAAGGVA